MDDELKKIFDLRISDIGATAKPLSRRGSKKQPKSKVKKNEDLAIFLDKDGNVMEPGSGDIARGEIWTYDENGGVTRTYVGDSWISATGEESENDKERGIDSL